MPFDTVERTHKRFRGGNLDDEDGLGWHPTVDPFPHKFGESLQIHYPRLPQQYMQREEWTKADLYSPTSPPPLEYSLGSAPIDIPSSMSETTSEYVDVDDHSTSFSWMDDGGMQSLMARSPESTMATPLDMGPPPNILTDPFLSDALSKFSLSYSDVGINMEARVSNATDLRSLIDAFQKMCCTSTTLVSADQTEEEKGGIILYRNRNSKLKPVNFFASACLLGQIIQPISKHGQMSLKHIADACIDTYFTCWVRYTPILRKDEFMGWYASHDSPTDTLIVNAICSLVFRHMVTHHTRPGLAHFLADQDKLQEQEEFFFNRARECLAQSFDTPDRFTVMALLFMCSFAEPSRRHHYAGMAVSALHELEIYPRMADDDDNDSFDKEMDTRLWWFAWSTDFYLYSAGAPRNTPQTRCRGEVDLPRIFEQDIDEAEIGVLADTHCLRLWRLQAELIQTIYEQEQDKTVDQLVEFDKRLQHYYDTLPPYLHFDSGFQYGCEDLFLACVRVNLEYNATRIILHKPFVPEINDPQPSKFSLRSLNNCLITSLLQLRTLNTCTKSLVGRCGFDRDELWRTAEVISMTMDIERNCSSADRHIILQNVNRSEYEFGLAQALIILQDTREYQSKSKNWVQVGDWIEKELCRHRLKISTTAVQGAYFTANIKPAVEKEVVARPPFPQPQPTPRSKNAATLQFQNQFVHHAPPPPTQATSTPSSASPASPAASQTRKPSFSAAPPFMQFNSYTPPTTSQRGGKSQARFRYFNPRKMNKFLFIDEHPMM
ncbi:hypothetical protein DFQ28_004549 [Apophysomyces sp. BC1034]|nr:hypothetical protein DFQ30_011210 [Apophysomyces sp. BC1015]KAG0179734.1 hypothetical protein DFQ29_001712 [Apophysomyces sp. BC1021]KAG0188658.1 hypothetical protein DFQ28_004549 [Apophysomyces sp. BC1034]